MMAVGPALAWASIMAAAEAGMIDVPLPLPNETVCGYIARVGGSAGEVAGPSEPLPVHAASRNAAGFRRGEGENG